MSAVSASPAASGSAGVVPADPVRALQHALYRAAKADPGRRFHALMDKVIRSDVLWRAWVMVRRNDGAPGIDKITLAQVEEYGVSRLLGELASELEEGRYRPLPARRVLSPSRARLRVSRGRCPFLRSALSPDEFGLISLYGITVAPKAGKPWREKPNAGVNGVGEPWAGEPHARFEAAGAGNGAPGHGHRSEAARRGNPGKSGCGT